MRPHPMRIFCPGCGGHNTKEKRIIKRTAFGNIWCDICGILYKTSKSGCTMSGPSSIH